MMKLALVALLLILLASAALAGEGKPVCYPGGSEMVNGILSTPQGYGCLATDGAGLQKINADILEIFGGRDKGITPSDVNKVESQMKALGKTVGHSHLSRCRTRLPEFKQATVPG